MTDPKVATLPPEPQELGTGNTVVALRNLNLLFSFVNTSAQNIIIWYNETKH